MVKRGESGPDGRSETDAVRVLRREMGITHAELYRLLDAALGGTEYRLAGDRILVGGEGSGVVIRVGPQRERRIAALRLPVTALEFRFPARSAGEAEAFMQRFERAYQKGGG